MMSSTTKKINCALLVLLTFVPFAWGFWTFHHFELQSRFDVMQCDTDPRFHISQFENYFQALLGRTSVVSPPYFYPAKGVLGYCDAMAGAAPIYCSFRLLHLDMYNATQAAVIVFDILNFLACFLLLKKGFNLKVFPSSIGAAFFTFNSVKYNQLEHYDFQALYFLPVIILCFILFIRRSNESPGKIKALWLAAVLIGAQFLTSFYMGWFFGIWSIVLGLIFLIFRWKTFFKKSLKELLPPPSFGYWSAGIIFVAAFIPFFALYLPVLHLKGPRLLSDVVHNMPTFKALMWMGDGNYVWGWLSRFEKIRDMDCQWENRLGLGLLFSLFWLFVTVKAVRNIRNLIGDNAPAFPFEKDTETRDQSVFETLVILSVWFCLILIMKRHYQPLLWQWIYYWVPGCNAILCTSRFAVVLMLPVSMIFAFEVQRFILRISEMKEPAKKIGAMMLIGVVLSGVWFEQMGGTPVGIFSVPADRAKILKLAARIPANATAFYVSEMPGCYINQIDAMLIAAVSGVPTLNGYNSSAPPGWNLEGLEHPDYHQRVLKWITDHQLGDRVFDLELKKGDLY
jgi:hypothetical protein